MKQPDFTSIQQEKFDSVKIHTICKKHNYGSTYIAHYFNEKCILKMFTLDSIQTYNSLILEYDKYF